MAYLILADIMVSTHLAFILFVVVGGFLALRWRRIVWAHLPAAVWGAMIELAGWTCPLTPLENWARRMGGEAGYDSGFIEHYITPIIYPSGLTRTHQLTLGILVIVCNLVAYGLVLRKRMRAADSP